MDHGMAPTSRLVGFVSPTRKRCARCHKYFGWKGLGVRDALIDPAIERGGRLDAVRGNDDPTEHRSCGQIERARPGPRDGLFVRVLADADHELVAVDAHGHVAGDEE